MAKPRDQIDSDSEDPTDYCGRYAEFEEGCPCREWIDDEADNQPEKPAQAAQHDGTRRRPAWRTGHCLPLTESRVHSPRLTRLAAYGVPQIGSGTTPAERCELSPSVTKYKHGTASSLPF